MALHFTIRAYEGTVAGLHLEATLEGDEIVLGRDEKADLQLPDLAVSRRHLSVCTTGEGLRVTDLGSRLGSRLNGKRLEAGKAIPLREGDELALGPYRVVFGGVRDRPAEQDTRSVALSLARRLAAQPPGTSLAPYLRVENGPRAGTRFGLAPGAKLRMGRGTDCAVQVDDARISRLHAVVHNHGGAIWLTDNGSANGSRVDGRLIHGPTPLADGAEIRLGRIRLVLVDPEKRRLDWVAAQPTGEEPTRLAVLPVAVALAVCGIGLAVLWLL